MVGYAETAGRRPPVIIKAPVLSRRGSRRTGSGSSRRSTPGSPSRSSLGLSAEMIVREAAAAGDQRRPAGVPRRRSRGDRRGLTDFRPSCPSSPPSPSPSARCTSTCARSLGATVARGPDDRPRRRRQHRDRRRHRRGALRAVGRGRRSPADTIDELWTPMSLERLARTYWRFLQRATLGLVRVYYTDAERYVCLLVPPAEAADLPRARVRDGRQARRRALAHREGPARRAPRARGRRLPGDRRRAPVRPSATAACNVAVEVEVANFYPAIASRLGRWLYAQTQSRIHVVVTHGLPALARAARPRALGGRPLRRRRRGARPDDALAQRPPERAQVRQRGAERLAVALAGHLAQLRAVVAGAARGGRCPVRERMTIDSVEAVVPW